MAKGEFYVQIDKRKLESLTRITPQQVGIAIRKMAFDGERYVKQSFGTSPSSAGSPPGVDTGALRSSIRTEKLASFSYQIVTGVDYAVFLEFGTSKMAARPFMGPLAAWLQKNVNEYFKNLID